MRRGALALTVFIAFFILATGVRAQSEYTSGVVAMRDCAGIDVLNGCWDESHPLEPRISCSPDNSKCVMLVYENRTGFQSLRVKYSTGVSGRHYENLVYGCPLAGTYAAWWDWLFGGCSEVGYINSGNLSMSMHESFNTTLNVHRGYDVQYINGDFYVIANIYERDTSRGSLYKVNSTGIYLLSGLTCSGCGGSYIYAASFCDDTGNATVTFEQLALTNTSGTVFDCDHFDVFQDLNSGYPSLVGLGAYRMNVLQYSAVPQLKVSYTTVNDSGHFYSRMKLGMGSFPTDYTGLDYYYGGQLLYQQDDNATYITHTTDFATYYNTTVYYVWDVGNAEKIFSSDISVDNTNCVYTFERSTNVTGTSGIYAYNEPIYSFQIRARGVDINSFTKVPISVESAISCNNNAWYYAQSGIDKILVTPCLTNNTIFISAAGWQPDMVYLTGIDSLNPVGITVITAPVSGFGFVNNYDVKFGAFDKFASQPINGATMSVDSATKLTGTNGIATYTLYPYTVANFYISNQSTTYYLSLFGTPKVYDVFASKTGYVTSDIAQVNLTGSSVPSGNSSFLRTYNIQLEPTNARLVIDVWWSDGIHYSGDTAVVRVGGNNGNIYLERGGVLYSQNYATSFPATFILQDNRSSWTASANVTYGSYSDSASIAVTSTVFYYFHDFYLPNSSTTHECTSDLGCGGTFCKANVWYHNGRCQTGACVYDFDSCVLCDDEAGCYTETTNVTCPTGLDAECIGMNYCIDTKNLASFKCSAGKNCFKSIEVCGYMCDSTEKVCLVAPVGVECDQSSVNGLLGCLQSGVLSFINSVYNPMFMIMVAIFVAVMLTTLFILVYKGISSVIG